METATTNGTHAAARLNERVADIRAACELRERLTMRVAELQQMEYETERRLLVIRNLLAEHQALLNPPPKETTFEA